MHQMSGGQTSGEGGAMRPWAALQPGERAAHDIADPPSWGWMEDGWDRGE
jgi:hypothetical protein